MSNVLQFVPRAKAQPVQQTRWDKLAAQSPINLVEYRLHVVLLVASWCYQTGRIRQGDGLIRECREQEFDPYIQLGKEFGDLIEVSDRAAAITGTLCMPEGEVG
jgi:hypothetical protein